ncbi:MAG: putative Ig domain-containing protein [Planctomycetes bacterium]|nr:putative Ig domain-containing protein [Planctomycetota bacterium]
MFGPLCSWIHKLIYMGGGRFPIRRAEPRKRPGYARLLVERLEDRVVPNAAPMINSAMLDSFSPKTNDILTVNVSASDSDSDPITFDYVWKVNGNTVKSTLGTSSTSDTLDLSQAGNGNKGDYVSVVITPYDPYTSGMTGNPGATVANTAPTFSISNQENMRGDVVSLQINASDADGDTLSYSAMGLPTGLNINSGSGLISGTVSSSAQTSTPYLGNITVGDGSSSPNQNFNWTITESYVAVVQGDQYNVAGETVSVDLYSWAPPTHTLSYGATGMPDGLSINSSTGEITGTIAYGEEASSPFAVTITATDSAAGIYDEAEFDWYVDAPEVFIVASDDLESIGGAEVEWATRAWSTDGTALTYSATGLPSGVSIDANTGIITGTISGSAYLYSPFAVTVTATNGGADISEHIDFNWVVGFLVLLHPGDQQNLVDSEVEIEVEAPYAETGTLSFGATGLPTGLSINTSTGVISGTIASNADDADPYEVNINVGDGTYYAEKTFFWDVKKVFLGNPGDQYGLTESTVELPLTVAALNGHTITYSATGLPDGLNINASTGVISGTIAEDANENGPFNVTITATDTTASVSASKNITWFVDINDQPDPNPYQPLARNMGEAIIPFLVRERANATHWYGVFSNLAEILTDLVPGFQQNIANIIAAHPNNYAQRADFIQATEQLQTITREITLLQSRRVWLYAYINALTARLEFLRYVEA